LGLQVTIQLLMGEGVKINTTKTLQISAILFGTLILLQLVWILGQPVRLRPLHMFFIFTGGVVCWTLLEYIFHRFLLHSRINPTTLWGKLTSGQHGVHHEIPNSVDDVGLPLGLSIPVYLIVVGVAYVVTADLAIALLFASGVICGYMIYEYTHYFTHHRIGRSRAGKFLKAYHLRHHHKNPGRAFGVTSPFWDIIFGTYEKK